MRMLVQRVRNAKVTVGGEAVGVLDHMGYLVFLGVCDADDESIAERMVSKLVNLRIFEDENGKTNKNLQSIGGGVLVVSQFTLYADCHHGNRPSFIKAGNPDHANALYEKVLDLLRSALGPDQVSHGIFGADMQVSLVNDGPFTIWLDSDEILH